MNVRPTRLPEVLLVEGPVFRDARGSFTEVFHAVKFADLGLPVTFEQDNHSRSEEMVLRGLHYQVGVPQGKLVRVVTGRIYDVAVDLRRSSPTFGQWVGEYLEAGDGRQLWIPDGFAHGFLVLSGHADVTYKCTTRYRAPDDRAVLWSDPDLGISWPLPPGSVPILSPRDAGASLLRDAEVFS